MFKIKMLCFDPTYGVAPYEDEPAGTNRFETSEEAYEKALALAEDEADSLNDGCDENLSFGVVEDEETDCVRVLCYAVDGPEDTTGETEQVTTYWVEEVEETKKRYWFSSTCRYPEDFDEDGVYEVWMVGDEDGPIEEFTDRAEFERWCVEHDVKI